MSFPFGIEFDSSWQGLAGFIIAMFSVVAVEGFRRYLLAAIEEHFEDERNPDRRVCSNCGEVCDG